MIAGAAGTGSPVRIALPSFARMPTTVVHTATFLAQLGLVDLVERVVRGCGAGRNSGCRPVADRSARPF